MPAAKKLAVTVHVAQDDGTSRVYLPGDEVPAEDAKKITNPDVWETSDPGKK